MQFCFQSATAVILSNDSIHVSNDRLTLVGLDVGAIKVFSSWKSAQYFFKNNSADLALIDGLSDTESIDCVKRIRRVSTNRLIPIVMVTTENRREAVLDAISAGCCGYVLRPYCMDTVFKHLQVAVESCSFDEIEEEVLHTAHDFIEQGKFDEAIEELEEIVNDKNESEKYFSMGMTYLANERYGKAIVAFNKALKLNQMFAEACKGMADAYRGKGKMEECQEYLSRAANIFAAQDRLEKTREMFVEIIKTDPDAVNPYNSLGVELRRKGDYFGALHAYDQAILLTPNDENLHYNIAKAHLFSGNKDKAVKHLMRSLELNPELHHSRDLLRKIRAHTWKGSVPDDASVPGMKTAGMTVDS